MLVDEGASIFIHLSEIAVHMFVAAIDSCVEARIYDIHPIWFIFCGFSLYGGYVSVVEQVGERVVVELDIVFLRQFDAKIAARTRHIVGASACDDGDDDRHY